MFNEHKHLKIWGNIEGSSYPSSKFGQICFAPLFLYICTINNWMTHLHSSIEGVGHWRGKIDELKTIVKSEKVGIWNNKVHITTTSTPLWIINCLGLSGGLGLGPRETLNEWKMFLWKSWMKEIRWITDREILITYFWFYTSRYK
jgi:hypothetical protein